MPAPITTDIWKIQKRSHKKCQGYFSRWEYFAEAAGKAAEAAIHTPNAGDETNAQIPIGRWKKAQATQLVDWPMPRRTYRSTAMRMDGEAPIIGVDYKLGTWT